MIFNKSLDNTFFMCHTVYMKAIYEHAHKFGGEKLERLAIGKNRQYPYFAHFHSNIEIFITKRGSFPIRLNGKRYTVGAGDIFIADHYDIHEYCPDYIFGDDDRTIIIPERFLINFDKARKNQKLLSPVIHNADLCEKLMVLIDDYIIPNIDDEQTSSKAVDLMMFMLLKELHFAPSDNAKDNTDLLKNILSYVHNNYKSEISLASIAKELGYASEHISRVFHKYFDYGIRDYINELRIEYVKANKDSSAVNVTDLIYDAGFKNTGTYYRQLAKYLKRKNNGDDKQSESY